MIKQHCYFIATSWGEAAVPKHFNALASELIERGHKVVLLVDGQKREVERHEGNPLIYTWPSRRPVKMRDAGFLFALIREHRPECLIANFGASNIMMLMGWLMNVPCRVGWYHTVSTAIEIDAQILRLKLKLLRWRKRLVYKAATHIIPASSAAREDIQRVFNVTVNKCRVFYNSLADPLVPSRSGQISAAPRQNKIVCVGRLYATKGQDVLIRALALVKHKVPYFRVEFLGDGPFKAQCQKLAMELGVIDRCIFAGAMRHDEVLERVASSIFTVVPSRSDNSPLVIIESLALGVPVVASGVGGIVESIKDGEEGFLVPPDDPESLADKITLLLADPVLLQTMRKNARQRFLNQFEQRKIVTEQAQWFESIAAIG